MSKLSGTATFRLKADYIRLKRDPAPYVFAEPLPSNLLELHYVVQGPEDSLYEGGYYHGQLIFPDNYPFKPPGIFMTTPSGRFQPNERLCLSISDYHPESWNPAWSVATILTGLLSFMLEDCATVGSIDSTDDEKREFATQSLNFNLKNETFCELFPDIVEIMKEKLTKREEEAEKAKLLGNATNGESVKEDSSPEVSETNGEAVKKNDSVPEDKGTNDEAMNEDSSPEGNGTNGEAVKEELSPEGGTSGEAVKEELSPEGGTNGEAVKEDSSQEGIETNCEAVKKDLSPEGNGTNNEAMNEDSSAEGIEADNEAVKKDLIPEGGTNGEAVNEDSSPEK